MRYIKRRIAFIHDDFPNGGGERVTIDVANYLAASGYEVFIFVGRFCPEKMSKDAPSNFSVIELPERYVEQSKVDADAIISSVNNLKIEILVSVGRQMLYIKDIQENTQCKYVYALHSIPFWETELILDRARRRSKESLWAKFEWYFISYPKYVWFKKAFRIIRKMYEESYNLSDKYIVLCDEYKAKMIKKLHLDSQNNKLRVISNSERKVDQINWNKKKQILYVGRMSYVDKRVDRLIDIWHKIYKILPDWELILVGDGDEKARLEEKVKLENLERVQFVGFSNDVLSFYRDASILCLVSTFEGWPLCLTEAQANGVVPISFDCSAGVHKIISPSGTNGLLVQPFDLDEYAKQILELINDPDLLDKMRYNVLKKSEEYSMEIVGKQWLSMLEELYV